MIAETLFTKELRAEGEPEFRKCLFCQAIAPQELPTKEMHIHPGRTGPHLAHAP